MNHSIKTISILIVIVFAFSTMAFRCGKTKSECNEVICTQEFRSFNITTVDVLKNAIIPDELVITNVSTGLPITTLTQNTSNTFTIFSDGNMNILTSLNIAQSIKIDAIVNNVIKGTTIFKFAKDCCHVVKISGSDSLVVN